MYVSNLPCYRSDGGDPLPIPARMSSPVSSYSIGDLRQAKYEEIPLTFKIDNNDGLFDPYMPKGSLGVPYWQGASVELYTGGDEDGDLTTGALEYKGTISIGGVKESANGHISVIVQPITIQYDIDLASTTVNETDYPTALEFGAYIPFRIGDFTGAKFVNDTALSTEIIAATTVPTRIQITTGTIDSVTVYRNSGGTWLDITGSCTINNTGGYVDVVSLTENDYFTVACECQPATYSGPSDYRTVNIIQWLLESEAGVPTTEIDTASFSSALASGDGYDVRRDIRSPSSIYQELSALALETGFSLYQTRTGKFGLQFFIPSSPSVAYEFRGDHSNDSLNVQHDPNKIYANRISMTFDNIGGTYRGAIDYSDAIEAAAYGKEVSAVIEYKWLYTQSAALLSSQRKLFFWKSAPEVISFVAPFTGNSDSIYDVFLLDTVNITYRRFDSLGVYVRAIDLSLDDGTISIKGYNMATLPLIGVWGYGCHTKTLTNSGVSSLAADFGYNVDVGQLIKIGSDDNGGAGYQVLTTGATSITFAPVIGSTQSSNSAVLPMLQIEGVGTWGVVANGSHWF